MLERCAASTNLGWWKPHLGVSMDEHDAPETEFPLPPASMQYHVFSRTVSPEEFLTAGRLCAESLERALSAHGFSTREFGRVLDFGCGSARVLRHFAPLFDHIAFHGSDVTSSLIDWDQANITGVTFHHNDAHPPLPFADGFFDYVWSISVFSHLPEKMALEWLDELRRIVRPGGIVLVTVHGPFRFEEDRNRAGGGVTADAVEEYERNGFTYVHALNDGILPDWYQNAFMQESYARRVYGRYFNVLDYIPQGMMGRQDVIMMQRRSAQPD
jgi:SAM-dependent methyltransferase